MKTKLTTNQKKLNQEERVRSKYGQSQLPGIKSLGMKSSDMMGP